MLRLNDKKLLYLIRYAPVVVVTLFATAVILIAIQDNQSKAAHSINNLRIELLNQQRETIRKQVRQVSQQIRIEKSRAEKILKVRAKQRVYEAYRVAHHIYKNHPDKPQSEITALITEALRPLNFFDGRGYFFIYTHQGLSVMHGLKPEMEGHSIWDEQDSRGKYIFQEFITLISQKGESFYQWRQQKPGHPENEQFTKIGFGKQFEPYGWLIGTGEYVVDVENEIKKQMLKWLSEYEYGEGGYFFVLDPQGTLLAHHYNDFLGLNLTIGNRVDDALFNEINTQVKNGGGYIRYQKPLTVNGAITLEQVSYVKQIKDWEWIIGTGFYSRAFEHYLAKKQQQLAQYNHQSLRRLWGLGVTSVLLLTGVSLYVSHLIARRFDRFQRRIAEDFETLEQTKNKMEFMALHDALTGLPNRLLLLEKIQQCIALSKQNDAYLAVMFVDMDNFKNVNDLHGHAAGDQLLEIVSRKFETILHTPEIVSRFGGDEFIFCFPNLKNTAEAQRKAALIHNVFNEPFIIAGKILSVGCSIGISMYPTDGDDPETLIHEADIVLYKSKSIKKRGEILFYNDSIHEQVQYDLTMVHELRHAISHHEISVYYQPQIDSRHNKMVSIEALARWHNPRMGDIPPQKFINAAEETGHIKELGLFVFRQACEDIYRLSPNSEDALRLSINVSPKQIMEPHIVKHFVAICSDIGIDIQRITLEITENILIHKLDAVIPILNQFREFGFGISLDDFGTGYSSLSYINNLPLTEIKIDRCFIDKMLENQQSNMLVKMIIGIGKFSGMKVVAEGVETKEQFQRIIAYECDLAQGYYFDHPLTIKQLSQRYHRSHEIPVNYL